MNPSVAMRDGFRRKKVKPTVFLLSQRGSAIKRIAYQLFFRRLHSQWMTIQRSSMKNRRQKLIADSRRSREIPEELSATAFLSPGKIRISITMPVQGIRTVASSRVCLIPSLRPHIALRIYHSANTIPLFRTASAHLFYNANVSTSTTVTGQGAPKA